MRSHGDAVLNVTIDEYARVFIEPTSENPVCFMAQDVACQFEVAADEEMEIADPPIPHRTVHRPINSPLLTNSDKLCGNVVALSSGQTKIYPRRRKIMALVFPGWEETVENL